MGQVKRCDVHKLNCSDLVQLYSSLTLTYSLQIQNEKKATNNQSKITSSTRKKSLVLSYTVKSNVYLKQFEGMETTALTHIYGSSVIRQCVVGENKNPVFVVVLRESPYALRAFPEATNLHSYPAIAGHIGVATAAYAHASPQGTETASTFHSFCHLLNTLHTRIMS